MTKEEIKERFHTMDNYYEQEGYEIRDVDEMLDEWAKYHAGLAFDAGYALAAKMETNFPETALTKEEYIRKNFPIQ
jgi:hypothetical protein